jgi:hypothetical protein
MCQPTYRLSNAIAPEGGCTGASADWPEIKWPDKRPELFRLRPVAHVRGVPGGPGRPDMGKLPAAPRRAPGRRRPGPGRPARDGPDMPRGASPGPLGHGPELLRFAGCGQASHRLRPGDGGPGGPGGARRDRCGTGSGPRPPPGRAAADNAPDHGSPARSSRTSDFHRANCALLWIRACNGLQRFTNAPPGRGIRPALYPDEIDGIPSSPANSRRHRDAAGASSRPSSAARPGGTRAVSSVPSCPCRTASTSPSACARESRSPRS